MMAVARPLVQSPRKRVTRGILLELTVPSLVLPLKFYVVMGVVLHQQVLVLKQLGIVLSKPHFAELMASVTSIQLTELRILMPLLPLARWFAVRFVLIFAGMVLVLEILANVQPFSCVLLVTLHVPT